MVKMEIEFKKAIFTSNQIIIKKKKQNIVIPLTKVDKLLYAKFSIKNYLSLGFGDYRTTGALYIYLKEKINNKNMYCFFIKYNNLVQIPENILKKIKFYVPGEPW
ncbi:hypothetical protein [Methanobrevibacter smithii]|uniref:hypothetical protein n=1 Tax=Methanobrevibacter smithii TaxID=2173 RepID=UPI0037DC5AA4